MFASTAIMRGKTCRDNEFSSSDGEKNLHELQNHQSPKHDFHAKSDKGDNEFYGDNEFSSSDEENEEDFQALHSEKKKIQKHTFNESRKDKTCDDDEFSSSDGEEDSRVPEVHLGQNGTYTESDEGEIHGDDEFSNSGEENLHSENKKIQKHMHNESRKEKTCENSEFSSSDGEEDSHVPGLQLAVFDKGKPCSDDEFSSSGDEGNSKFLRDHQGLEHGHFGFGGGEIQELGEFSNSDGDEGNSKPLESRQDSEYGDIG
ncbi:unnamed protein product, partial [Gongylonema pulchrum]|uniref:Uncharacterized protein n=1 Tax=Gongylonema pulchrum TaxID=637853 RepID=A0A183DJC1_9BILA